MIPNLTSAVAGGLNVGLGLLQYFNAKKALRRLNQTPVPKYSLDPAIQDSITKADMNRNQGLGVAENNAFRNDVIRGNNTAYQRAFSQAPTLSNAISASINAQNQNAYLKLAALNAQRRMDNTRYSDSLRGQLQQVRNMNTAQDIYRRNTAEQAWGGAMQAGLNNIITGATLGVGSIPQGRQTFGQVNGQASVNKIQPMSYGFDNPYANADVVDPLNPSQDDFSYYGQNKNRIPREF